VRSHPVKNAHARPARQAPRRVFSPRITQMAWIRTASNIRHRIAILDKARKHRISKPPPTHATRPVSWEQSTFNRRI
jgi:hypothetical protein